jgi:hypothetical protein
MIAAEERPELVAGFGGAEVAKLPDGTLEIRGGTDAEKTEAHQWVRQFLTQERLTVRRVGDQQGTTCPNFPGAFGRGGRLIR